MEAVVLAGGLGTRLRSVVSDVPKPMAPVGGRPFLRHACAGDHVQGCGIIDSLDHGSHCTCCEEEHCPLNEYPASADHAHGEAAK